MLLIYYDSLFKYQGSDKIFKREELGLPKNAFVFCCFNQNNKITPNIFDIWMKILKTVDKSVLWMLEDNSFTPGRRNSFNGGNFSLIFSISFSKISILSSFNNSSPL